jgi:Acyl-CoA dehydrogenase, C-terminal domain
VTDAFPWDEAPRYLLRDRDGAFGSAYTRRIRAIMNRGYELVAQAINDMFRASTGRAVFVDHPLQQRFQDIEAAMAHA